MKKTHYTIHPLPFIVIRVADGVSASYYMPRGVIVQKNVIWVRINTDI